VDDASGFVAAITSLHVDGRLRERATRALAAVDGTIATRALAVRLLDHVPQVRHEALAAVLGRLDLATADLVLDILRAGCERQHAAATTILVQEHLFAELGESRALRHLMASRHRPVRRWAYDLADRRGVLADADLLAAAQVDEDQWVRAMCARRLSQGRPDLLGPLLSAEAVEARLAAVTGAPDDVLDDATLSQLLLDRAPRVREQARWRARRRGLDTLAVYRRQTEAAGPVRVRVAALEGLGTVGDSTDLPAVLDGLRDPSARVRVAALGSVELLADPADVVGLLLPLLDDPRGRVSAAAARRLARREVPPAQVERLWEAVRPTTRRAAWRVAREAGGWDRVEADLRAASDEDPDVARLGEAGLRTWLAVGAATTWERLPSGQRERIATHLAVTHLDDGARRLVAFHAGITTTPEPAPGAFGPRTDEVGKRRWWRRGRPG
jgi:HEAT repeat protein